MIPLERTDPNGAEALDLPVVSPLGFREYDARWRYPEQINLAGMTAVGLGIGTQIRRRGLRPEIVVGGDRLRIPRGGGGAAPDPGRA